MNPGEKSKIITCQLIKAAIGWQELTLSDWDHGRYDPNGCYLIQQMPLNRLNKLINVTAEDIVYDTDFDKKFVGWLSHTGRAGLIYFYNLVNEIDKVPKGIQRIDLVAIRVKNGEISQYAAIEIDGRQHYEPVRCFKLGGSPKKAFAQQCVYDYIKDISLKGHIIRIRNFERVQFMALDFVNAIAGTAKEPTA